MISLEQVSQALTYEPESGIFRWKYNSAKRRTGEIAGALNNKGYTRISIKQKRYFAHRLAWLCVTGEWPDKDIDHINGNRADNRIANLRLAERYQNNGNSRKPSHNSSGVKGVHWSAKERKWVVQIHHNNCPKRIGCFDDLDRARLAYARAAKNYFGEFARPE